MAGFLAGACGVPDYFANTHICGIGGIGTSGVALLLRSMDLSVSGSDLRESVLTRLLEARGCRVVYHADPEDVEKSSCLVVSAGVPDFHPEIVAAHAHGIPILDRAHALSFFCARYVERVALCFGTLSRARCARWLSRCLSCGICAGIAAPDGSAHAVYGREMVVDLDEREVLRAPELLHAFSPAQVVISDWALQDFGYYASGERLEELCGLCQKTGASVVYPVFPERDDGCEFAFRGARDAFSRRFLFERTPKMQVGIRDADSGRFCAAISGTLHDARAACAVLTLAGATGKTLDTGMLAEKFVGWFENIAPGQFYDIRMHPVSIRAALDGIRFCMPESAIVVAIRPFISTLRRYGSDLWREALRGVEKVMVISPPYEGCSEQEGAAFGRMLSDGGIHAEISSLLNAKKMAHSSSGMSCCWLWVGAPDLSSL